MTGYASYSKRPPILRRQAYYSLLEAGRVQESSRFSSCATTAVRRTDKYVIRESEHSSFHYVE